MKFIDELDVWLLKDEGRKRTSHYPSDMMSCARATYWKFMVGDKEHEVKKTNPPTAGNMVKMKMGNAIESIVDDFLDYLIETERIASIDKQMHYRIEIEGLKYPIGMRLDNGMTMNDGEMIGIEVKSTFGRGVAEIQKKKQPKPEHLAQIYPYLEYTPYKKFILPYFGRDNGYRTEFWVKQAEGGLMVAWPVPNSEDGYGYAKYELDWSKFIEKFKRIEAAVEAHVLPDRDFMVAIKNGEIKDKFQANKVEYRSDWNCMYCDWKDHCWADVLPEFADSNNSEDFNIHKEIKEEKDKKELPKEVDRSKPDLEDA